MKQLPIDSVLPELIDGLRGFGSAVLVAQPGAGKTTRVPLALADEPWLAGRRIVMLEPRRLAARAASRYMAETIGDKLGGKVGYRIRMDSRVGPHTRIEVITEGILTRMLQSDPSLEGVGLVIFDEFHERSLQADLGLALCLQAKSLFRDDLRILIMSATLDAEPAAKLLGGAPIIHSEGRVYPVETRYIGKRPEEKLEEAVARCVLHALQSESGDILVFLPGTAEIRRAERLLAERRIQDCVQVMPLHGNLPQEAQDRAISPSLPGKRKVVLSTSIAETSLTIEGTRIVIDSGWMRVPRFSPGTGLTRLETVRVSIASADQRRGRAGRIGPGICYRLWTEQEEAHFEKHGKPEILQSDLAPLALELAVWGTSEPSDLLWLDEPPQAAYRQSRELLHMFGALTAEGAITGHGRLMAGIGTHPRLAHMMIRAIALGAGAAACDTAALLNERDVFRRGAGIPEADLRLRLEAMQQVRRGSEAGASPLWADLDLAACRRAIAEADLWRRTMQLPESARPDSDCCGMLLSLAYPDRIAARRSDGRYLLSNGRGAILPAHQPISGADYLAAAELDDQGTESRIVLAAPVELRDLETTCSDRIVEEEAVEWDRTAQAVRARKRKRLGALVLIESPLPQPSRELAASALARGLRTEGIGILPWTTAAVRLRERIAFMQHHDSDWPDLSDETLTDTLESWLLPFTEGMKSRADLQKLNMVAAMESLLTWEQRRLLDEYAPSHLYVPSGSKIPIDYSDPQAPALSVRLQEVFGLRETPRIAGGKVPITMHLLSPAQRPVQVTQDLGSFWKEAYFEVKKDLKGRYPKHYWPDDPNSAAPTSRTRPKP